MMIYSLTLNPAVDVFVVDGKRFRYAGGKGLNVTRALKKWGVPSTAVAMIGGNAGLAWRKMAEKESLSTHVFIADGETRTNVVYYGSRHRRTTKHRIQPSFTQRRLFCEKIKKMIKKDDWLVVSGSAPNQDMCFYDDVLKNVSAQRLILDVNGEALNTLLRFNPYLIKPNQQEAEQCVGFKLTSEKKIRTCVERLCHKGASNVVLSLGAKGVAAFIEGEYYRCTISLKIKGAYPVGCGDVLVAGCLAFGHLPPECMLIQSVAAASAGTRQLKPGFFLKKHSRIIAQQIEVAK